MCRKILFGIGSDFDDRSGEIVYTISPNVSSMCILNGLSVGSLFFAILICLVADTTVNIYSSPDLASRSLCGTGEGK